jgi:hypothetical protein
MPTTSLWDQILWNQAQFGGGSTAGLARQTAGGLIYAALRKAGVTLGPGRIPAPAQMQDGLDELNRFIGSLNCDRLFIYSLDVLELPLVADQTSYTIGLDGGADLEAPRPQAITAANLILPDGGRWQLGIYTAQQWAVRAQNGLHGIYDNRAAPLSTTALDGEPSGGTLELYTWHQVPAFVSESDAVLLPPGYEDALVLNLAVRLATQFQRAADPMLRDDARLSLMRVLSLNAPQPIADVSFFGSCGCGDTGAMISLGGASPELIPGPQGPPGPPGPPGPSIPLLVNDIVIHAGS